MANNPYVNRVETADGSTLMDITDTTAESSDVLNGEVFYTASGQRSTGSLSLSNYVQGPSSATDGHVAAFDGTTGKLIKDSGYTIAKSVPSDAKFTDTTYSAATQSADGLMSSADKTKLDGIATGANKTTVSNSLSDTSTTSALSANQGKVLNDDKLGYYEISNTDLNTITKSGIYGCVTGNTNTPSSAPYGMMVHMEYRRSTGNKYYTQVYYGTEGGVLKGIYWRTTNANAASWSSWSKLLEESSIVDNLTSTSTTSALSANQGKVLNDSTVKTTGAQSVGGSKTFTGVHYIKNSGTSPSIIFQSTELSDFNMRLYADQCGTSNVKYGAPRLNVYAYSPSSDGTSRTSYYESYVLPRVSVGRTSNAEYSIHTSKDNALYFGDASVARNHILYFKHKLPSTDSTETCGYIEMDSGNTTNQTLNRFAFVQYSPKSTDDPKNTGKREIFYLPSPTKGLSADASYTVLTTKSNAIYDGLDSTSTTRPLSANQGKQLKTFATATSTTFGTTAYTTHVNPLGNRIIKQGNKVDASITILTTDNYSFPAGTAIMTVPSGYRPSSNIKVPAMLQGSDGKWNAYEAWINANGNVGQDWSSTCKGIYISASYLV